MGVCGDGTGRLCPDPSLPIPGNDTATITPDGKVILPPGKELPKIVPFSKGH